MQRIRDQIRLAATTDSNVLITGETGVGKNVVARAIHDLQQEERTSSWSTARRFRKPDGSEYFGHEKGYSPVRTPGVKEFLSSLMEGPFVLDEIGEIPIRLQSKTPHHS